MRATNLLIAICGLALVSAASGGVVRPFYTLPPEGSGYFSSDPVFQAYGGGQYLLRDVVLHDFSDRDLPPLVPTNSQTYGPWGFVFDAEFSADGGATYTPVSAPGIFSDDKTLLFDTGSLQLIDDELDQLEISGGSLPAGVKFRSVAPSFGQITIQASSAYQIDSFFDVFSELSSDNGGSWMPSNGSGRIDLAELPEPGVAWAYVGLLAVVGRRGMKMF